MQRILVATDLTAGAHHALGRACRVARETGAALRILHVPPHSASEEDCTAARHALRARIDAFDCAPSVEGDPSIRLTRGDPATVILDEARRFAPDLIILGAHGEPRLRDAIFGTTASHVAREADQPVLIVQNDHERRYLKVMVAVEEDTAEQVVRLACDIAPVRDLIVVHAYGSASESLLGYGEVLEDVRADQQAMIGRVLERLAGTGNVPPHVESVVEEGEVVSVLMKAWGEHRPDLVVMGTHGRSGLAWLFKGSVAETAMLTCPSDILVARAASSGRAAR